MKKKKRTVSAVKNSCDKLWSKIIRSVGHCEYCGSSDNLNAHHVHTRARLHSRFSLDNGVCLCALHHTFSKVFSAHVTAIEFGDWIRARRGEAWYIRVLKLSQELGPMKIDDYLEIEKDLKTKLSRIESNNEN